MTLADTKKVTIKPTPPTQALNSTTFRVPPLDGSLSTLELLEWHYRQSPNHPVFLFEDTPGNIKTVYWSQWYPAIHRAGHYVRRVFSLPELGSTSERPVIAILANSDTFTYSTTQMGIVRANCIAFPLSPRNSAVAVAHLLEKTGAKHVLVTEDLRNLATTAVASMTQATPHISPMPSFFEDLFPEKEDDFDFLPMVKCHDINDRILMLHSSGSTAFPKPVPFTHLVFQLAGRLPYYGERDLTGVTFAAHAVPVFHGMGLSLIFWTISCGLVCSSFKPASPPTLPTPDLVYAGAVATKSEFIFCVPLFVEVWSRDPEKVEYFKTIQGLWYAGAPLKKAVGDELNAQGVPIYQLYGSTESTTVTETLPKAVSKDWDYFKFSGHFKPHFIPDGHGAFELIIEATPEFRPNVINTKIEGADAYATSDLFVPHPTIPGYWKTYGRVDDQIMHNSGEKTNPGPLEGILNSDPCIKAAVIFGTGRFNAGVIIDPIDAYKFDPKDEKKLVEFKDKIWPTVERMNKYAPQHSRIFKEMIMVSSVEKPFVYTAKLTARRQTVIIDYGPEIEALYAAVEESTQAVQNIPPSWTPETSLKFARSVVGSVLKEKVSDDDDIFQHSCDSLQATWIRNSILHALRKTTQINTREIESAFVYQHPSVSSLGRFIAEVTSSGGSTTQGSKIDEMKNLVSKYTKNFGIHKASTTAPTADVVLITGTTGGIGSNVLAKLARSPKVAKIYALTRKSTVPSVQRQREALKSRGLDHTLVDSPKVVVRDGDLAKTNLGLTQELFREIQSSVTHIIHIGWRVDFNLSLQSFEANVRGVRHLIDLTLSSPLPEPPRLLFTSSIAVLRHYPKKNPVPEQLVVAESAVGQGYGESKWVSEQILALAGAETATRPIIVRVGQVTGGANGYWNSHEWIPSIVRSAAHVKCLPSLDQVISLIPSDLAAMAIIEMRNSPAEILHLTHPKPVSWNVVFQYIAKALNVELVPYADWLSRVEASETEGTIGQNPALRLLDFYKSVLTASDGTEAAGLPKLVTTVARKMSPTLGDENIKSVGPEEVEKWLNYWKSIDVISF